ncbi:DUF429 domain-containing protein [Dokdonia sinensis]|uniref:DUF429 domain-containing protein n=1 Tax=Dokdonia sinensis TaxID=2479847 RepID=A0A3M0GE82_9FLAO|nr:DUF429 domain-containing protein [Dokdonia sinensis]RMB59459.1 DUF429 domain-containing protein [Dokdonia sinensis]
MIYAGIDGCKSGWLLVYYDGEFYKHTVLKNFEDIAALHIPNCRILVDIPIGLTTENFTRTIEATMRAELGKRSSTVFNAPARPATRATDKAQAREINIKFTGKSLSEQSLNIMPKIKEVDEFLLSEDFKHYDLTIYESHPELCFKYLAGEVIQSRKSMTAGIEERLQILECFETNVRKLYDDILSSELRKNVKRDDIVDAICLCLVNRLAGENGLQILKDTNHSDEAGLGVGIGYYKKK